jgi:hypothetical protein
MVWMNGEQTRDQYAQALHLIAFYAFETLKAFLRPPGFCPIAGYGAAVSREQCRPLLPCISPVDADATMAWRQQCAAKICLADSILSKQATVTLT